ncbi:MAG: hypothetical protein WD934_09610 [Gemmatimonadales bacterium]
MCWLLVVGGVSVEIVAGQARTPLVHILEADGGESDLDLRTVRRGFALYAAADRALTGMRMTGNHGAAFSNYGDCTNVLWSCQNQRSRPLRAAGKFVIIRGSFF